MLAVWCRLLHAMAVHAFFSCLVVGVGVYGIAQLVFYFVRSVMFWVWVVLQDLLGCGLWHASTTSHPSNLWKAELLGEIEMRILRRTCLFGWFLVLQVVWKFAVKLGFSVLRDSFGDLWQSLVGVVVFSSSFFL